VFQPEMSLVMTIRRVAFAAWIMFVALVAPSWSQAPPAGDAMIEKYLAQETAKLSQRFLDGAKTRAEWEGKRPRLYQEYLDMLGLFPLPEKTPLQATVTGTLERDDFVVEKLHYQSRPGLYVTGNLYRPKKIEGKLPAILYVCGHSNRGRAGNKAAFQDHGMWFAKNGFVCLAIDTLQLGEIPGVHHGTYGRPWLHLKAYGIPDRDKVETRWWWQALGYTPAGVECWNGVRGIDYLVSRPDVDAQRIGVTGISGGGAATFWIAAADERVKCAVPVSGMSDLESYVTNKVANGHCDCMFLINTYQWEWTTIAALVAPRPLLFANSDNDRIFPMDGNRRIIERLRSLYQMYEKPELLDEYVSKGGHDYRPDLRIAIFRWMNKHLKNDSGPVTDSAEFKFFPDEQMRVFKDDKDIPKDAINDRIDEMFVAKAQVQLPEAGKFAEWQKGMVKQLREKSFRGFSEKSVPTGKPKYEMGSVRNDRKWVTHARTEEGINVFLSLPFPNAPDDPKSRTVIVFDANEGSGTGVLPDWANPYADEHKAARVWPRGLGVNGTQWRTNTPPNYVERSHALMGRTVDQGRVWDIISTVQRIDSETNNKKTPLRVIGRGQAGILAAYAALFEPSIQEVVIVDPPVSHREGPIFLNVLRVLDIPEALGLLAPRKLTLINAKDKAFDRTEQIYMIAGAADQLQRKP
jgi:cephalosporin-C deacetylase-like acetyl esterase